VPCLSSRRSDWTGSFGGADSQGSATYAGFTAEFADEVLLPGPGKATSIVVAAEPGVSQAELVR
jgi:putative ABC transport system permease protein